jgi:hypothetical protein
MNLLEKQINQHHDIGFLIINIQANRVAIVSSVITKYMQVFDYSVYFSGSGTEIVFQVFGFPEQQPSGRQ